MSAAGEGSTRDIPIKKRRLVNGQELVFRRPGEESDEEDRNDDVGPMPEFPAPQTQEEASSAAIAEGNRITIHED